MTEQFTFSSSQFDDSGSERPGSRRETSRRQAARAPGQAATPAAPMSVTAGPPGRPRAGLGRRLPRPLHGSALSGVSKEARERRNTENNDKLVRSHN